MIDLKEGPWIVLEMNDDVILQALDYMDQPKDNALNAAVELAMENGYEYGRNDARDILDNDGRLVVNQEYIVYITQAK
jgi:hypothetical protein